MIRNLTKNCFLAERERWATGYFTRFRGLIGHDFSLFDGMVFPDCSAIHTFFMGMEIDVLFIDRECTVLKACSNVPRWKSCLKQKGAWATIELPAGTIFRTQTAEDDILRLENVRTDAILMQEQKQ